MQLFELKSISRTGNKRPDGSYPVFERELGIFDSVENAETFMKKIIAKEGEFFEFHCFIIFEKTLNKGLSGNFESVSEFESVRSYLPDGTLYCDSPYDDAGEKPFRGRPAESIGLNVGNIAWYWWYGDIYPCLIGGLPFSDTRYRELVRERGREIGLDASDDSYMVYTGHGHEHPECWRCLPYYGKISRRNLQRLYKDKQQEEAYLES